MFKTKNHREAELNVYYFALLIFVTYGVLVFFVFPSDFQSACVIKSIRMALSSLKRPRELTPWKELGILRQRPRRDRILQKKNMSHSSANETCRLFIHLRKPWLPQGLLNDHCVSGLPLRTTQNFYALKSCSFSFPLKCLPISTTQKHPAQHSLEIIG